MNRVLSILFCAFSMVAVPSVAGSNKMLSNEKVGTILKIMFCRAELRMSIFRHSLILRSLVWTSAAAN